jgi:hypothetical protein
MDTENEPFVLSLSKHEWHSHAPFDKLRVNGGKYVFTIMDSLVTLITEGISGETSYYVYKSFV